MDFDRLRQYLQWLRGEDGVALASQAMEVMAQVLGPLLAAEGLELFAPESPGLGVDLIAATPNENERGNVSLAIEYKHLGRRESVGRGCGRTAFGTHWDNSVQTSDADRSLRFHRCC